MNFYDSDRMAQLLSPLGYEMTQQPDDADITILNTCHIREKAEQKMYSDLGRLARHRDARHSQGLDMIIAVGGCVGQAEGIEIRKNAPYVSMVFGPQTYHRLPEMIAQLHRNRDAANGSKNRGIVDIDFPAESKFDHLPAPKAQGPSAFVSVQEGCDKFCHFCVVPYTRGAEYSRPAALVLKEIEALVLQGVKEVTLLGQNVNAYHGEAPNGTKEWSLGRLLMEAANIDGLKRLRYITSHPRDMHEELYTAHRDIDILMPYLHLPIQAGSDRILEAMNRKHTRREYLDIIEKLRTIRPDLALSSDFIVGYPGETDGDFNDTLQIVRNVSYASAYSFSYSPRPGTPASVLETQVDESVKSERLQILQAAICEEQLKFNMVQKGEILPVLFERPGKHEGQMIGKSPYLQSVYVNDANPRLHGQIVDVEITDAFQNSLTGNITTRESHQDVA